MMFEIFANLILANIYKNFLFKNIKYMSKRKFLYYDIILLNLIFIKIK